MTEGTRAGIGDNWERCDYDWSQPGSVMATVNESNVYEVPGSSWEIKATPTDGGSRVEMIWIREFQRNARGRIFGTAFRVMGNRIFNKYGRDILTNLERLEPRHVTRRLLSLVFPRGAGRALAATRCSSGPESRFRRVDDQSFSHRVDRQRFVGAGASPRIGTRLAPRHGSR